MDNDLSISNVGTIMSQSLTITGDNLTIIGNPGTGRLSGGNGITAVGKKDTLFLAAINIEIDYLYVKGGQGSNGSQSSVNGANGGIGIICWLAVNISSGSKAYVYGGEGGAPYQGGTAGTRGDDLSSILTGSYYGSNGYVTGE